MPRLSLLHRTVLAALVAALPAVAAAETPPRPPADRARVEAALTNVMTLDRPGQTGLATVWDGNKYVQCRRDADRALRCEAAGTRLQPSLAHVLTRERVAGLVMLGWMPDPAFGNYAQTFPATMTAAQVADEIVSVLGEGYDADLADLEVATDWVQTEPCPPRNGPRQNLAGMINDAPAMAETAIHACSYAAPPPDPPRANSVADLIATYGPRLTGEVQRLIVNRDRRVYLVVEAVAGYIQCQPQTTPPILNCEAASADSVPALAVILTPERIARLHAAGYADPGRVPNYARTYPLNDTAAIVRALLTTLHDVYGYDGTPKLKVVTETGGG